MNAHIFREYDIRGIVAKDLTGDVPRQIGLALGSELRARLKKKAGQKLTVAISKTGLGVVLPIMTLQVVSRARRAGLRITPRQLFEHPTVAAFADP